MRKFKHIVMCGGIYPYWSHPKQTSLIKGEPLVARTIRLLRECGVEDIAISSNDPIFEQFGVSVLHHDNKYVENYNPLWVDCFFPMEEPTTYLFGDVVFSPEAIKTIVETETDDIEFFGSCPPFAANYPKKWVEPFAFKVVNHEHLREAIAEVKYLEREKHAFKRNPISWDLWSVIKGTPLNQRVDNYVVINDYTCDIDKPEDIDRFNGIL